MNENPAGAHHGNAPQGFPPQNNTLGPMSQGPPQLPPQMFTTAAQLLDLTDSALYLFTWPPWAYLTNGDGRNLTVVSRKASSSPSRRAEVDRSFEKLGSVRYAQRRFVCFSF